MKKQLLSLILVLLSSCSYGVDKKIALTVDVKSPSFNVILPANPTTGYQWTLKTYDQSFLTLKSSQYQAPKTNLIGAGGQMLYVFALQPGKQYPQSTQMLFEYARSWEKEPGSRAQVTVTFTDH